MKLRYIIIRPKHFSSNEEAITFVNNYFVEKNAEYYFDGLQRWDQMVTEMGPDGYRDGTRWLQSWEKCVELQGDYVEKCLVSLLGRKLFRPPS